MAHRPAILDHLDKVEEAIRLFDSHYDVRQLYAFVTDLFRSVPRPEDTNTPDLRWAFAYLGAAWAQIVTSVDLTYQLGQGYQVHDDSFPIAENLLTSAVEHPSDPVFGKQVLVRWYDASAKLYYRTGDHTTARVFWDKCLTLLQDERLAFVCPDIKSSSRRNEYEETRQTTIQKESQEEQKDKLKNSLQPLIDETLRYFESHHPLLAAYLAGLTETPGPDLLASLTARDRERLRGLANLYQNSFQPQHVERIAELTGDQLRLMQALHEQARILYEGLEKIDGLSNAIEIYTKASSLWKRVRDAEYWRRGQLMARQNLAVLERDFIEKVLRLEKLRPMARPIHLFASLRELISLVDDIQSAGQDAKGSDAALGDVDLHGWTVLFADKTLDMLKEWGDLRPHEADELQKLEARVIGELEQMVRDHRKVIRVGVYKHAFAKYHQKLYQRIVRHYYKRVTDQGQSFRNLVAWIEESSSRELLDMVASRRREAVLGSTVIPSSEYEYKESIQFGDKKGRALPRTNTLRRLRSADGELKERIVWACLEAERDFNVYAKKHPVTAAQISPEIVNKTQRFADEKQSLVVRFFQFGDEEYGAVVFEPAQQPYVPDLPYEIRSKDGRQTRVIPVIEKAVTQINEVLKSVHQNEQKEGERIKRLLPVVGRAVGEIMKNIAGDAIKRQADKLQSIIVIPVGRLWKIPFHAAIIDEKLLCTHVPILYSMSISALVEHGRHAALTTAVQPKTLGVCSSYSRSDREEELFGRHIVNEMEGSSDQVFGVCGPAFRASTRDEELVTRETLQNLLSDRIGVLYFGCHGEHYADDLQRSCLVFHNTIGPGGADATVLLPPEQLALLDVKHEIPLVILAACVSGQGVGLPGGEVSGFYRAMAALGARTCLLSFWPVASYAVDDFALKMIQLTIRDGVAPLPSYRKAIEDEAEDLRGPPTGEAMMRICCLGMFV